MQLIFITVDISYICALTDVPFYVMWIIFFIVWTVLFIDFIKRYHAQQLKKEEEALEMVFYNTFETRFHSNYDKEGAPKKEKKEKFDAYEAAGIIRNSFKFKTKR